MRPVRWLIGPMLTAILLATGPAARTQGTGTITVATAGQADERFDSVPVALAAARVLRTAHPSRPIVVTLPPGLVRLAAPIALTAADSGTTASPLTIRAASQGTTLSGARIVGAGGDVLLATTETPLLYQGDTRLPLTTWPAQGWATGWRFENVPEGLLIRPANGLLPVISGRVIVEGYFGEDYAYQASPAVPRDGGLLLPGFVPDPPMKPTARLRIRGNAADLVPGRYVLADGGIRARPRGAMPVELAKAPGLLTITRASNIRIEGIRFEKAGGDAILIDQASDVRLRDCFVGHVGGVGITVTDGTRVTIDRCTITDTGGAAVILFGGNRPALTPSGNALLRSTISRFGRTIRNAPGVILWGVGNMIAASRIAGGQHSAIAVQGNDHRIEGNEIGWAVCETNDAGAIYMGRDWTQRGIVIRDNFLHDIGGGRAGVMATGVYLDDQFSGARVTGNVFFGMPHGVFVGGGRDNAVNRNLFARIGRSALHFDRRGMTWQAAMVAPGGQLQTLLAAMPYRSGLWQARYPTLATLPENQPGEPIGNDFSDNSYVESQILWSQPTDLEAPHRGDRKPPPTPADWQRLAGDALAAWPVLARLGEHPVAAAWRTTPATGVRGCEG